MAFSVSDTVSSAQADLEKLVTDVRGLLASKDLDSIPQINVLRQKLDDGVCRRPLCARRTLARGRCGAGRGCFDRLLAGTPLSGAPDTLPVKPWSV